MSPTEWGGLVRSHEPEERFEVLPSVANQAAAFERISRSSFGRRFSRRSLVRSSRSALVGPPSPLPLSRAACFTHVEIDQDVGPNSFANEAGVCPVRTRSTICRLNSGVYRTDFSATVNSSKTNVGVSTKAAQVQSATRKITHAVARIIAGLQRCLRLQNLDARRNWGYAADYVRAMWLMLQAPVADTYSVHDFCRIAFDHVGLDYKQYVPTLRKAIGRKLPSSWLAMLARCDE